MRTKEQMRRQFARNMRGIKRGNACHKVKFSRSMWDRLLESQNEYAALRQVRLP